MQAVRRSELLFGEDGAPPGAEIIEDGAEVEAAADAAARVRLAVAQGYPLPELTVRADLASYSFAILRALGEGTISTNEAMALYGVLEKHVGMLAVAKIEASERTRVGR